MSNSDLTQLEVDKLIKMSKYPQDEQKRYTYPNVGEITIPLLSLWQTRYDFMNFCNIQKIPIIDRGLF